MSLHRPFLVFGVAYQLTEGADVNRLIRVHDDYEVATYSQSWEPREVIRDATHNARAFTGKTLPTVLTGFLIAGLLAVSAPAWGKGRTNPPNDKPIDPPIRVEREGNLPEASWQWWVSYAGYLEAGPYPNLQQCEAARRRFPSRYACLPVRD